MDLPCFWQTKEKRDGYWDDSIPPWSPMRSKAADGGLGKEDEAEPVCSYCQLWHQLTVNEYLPSWGNQERRLLFHGIYFLLSQTVALQKLLISIAEKEKIRTSKFGNPYFHSAEITTLNTSIYVISICILLIHKQFLIQVSSYCMLFFVPLLSHSPASHFNKFSSLLEPTLCLHVFSYLKNAPFIWFVQTQSTRRPHFTGC